MSGDYSIGSYIWPGLSKLIEEAGEVQQICGKLIGSSGDINHFDGSNLKERLEDEIADLTAALDFVSNKNGLDGNRIMNRYREKLKLFEEWHREGLSS